MSLLRLVSSSGSSFSKTVSTLKLLRACPTFKTRFNVAIHIQDVLKRHDQSVFMQGIRGNPSAKNKSSASFKSSKTLYGQKRGMNPRDPRQCLILIHFP